MLRLNLVKYSLLPFIILFLQATCIAQLKADFTTDKPGGCTPLTIFFTSTTSGASSSAVYLWNLGNGNTSSLKNAGTVFTSGKTYTITLSVSDSNKISSATHTISVYEKPVADFCFPAERLYSTCCYPQR